MRLVAVTVALTASLAAVMTYLDGDPGYDAYRNRALRNVSEASPFLLTSANAA